MNRPIDLSGWFGPTLLPPFCCPACHSRDIVPIAYGLPSADTRAKAEAGLLVLGGCCLRSDGPAWCCKTCEHRWARPDSDDITAEEERAWRWCGEEYNRRPSVVARRLYDRVRRGLSQWIDTTILAPLTGWWYGCYIHKSYPLSAHGVYRHMVRCRRTGALVRIDYSGSYYRAETLRCQMGPRRQALIEKAAIRIAKSDAAHQGLRSL